MVLVDTVWPPQFSTMLGRERATLCAKSLKFVRKSTHWKRGASILIRRSKITFDDAAKDACEKANPEDHRANVLLWDGPMLAKVIVESGLELTRAGGIPT